MTPLYKNQSIELRIDTSNLTLASATVKKILYKKPSGVTGFWTATQSGTKLVYSTLSADLDETGEWWFQPYAEFTGLKRFGDTIIKQRVIASL